MLYRESYCPDPPYERLRIEGRPRETMVASLMQEIALGLSPWAKLDGDALQVLGCTGATSGAR